MRDGGNGLMDTPTRPWREIIDYARKRGFFTEQEKAWAGSWVTCACGEQDPRIPRSMSGEPLDSALCAAGTNFSIAVGDDNLVRAKYWLKRIERHATRVLREVSQ